MANGKLQLDIAALKESIEIGLNCFENRMRSTTNVVDKNWLVLLEENCKKNNLTFMKVKIHSNHYD